MKAATYNALYDFVKKWAAEHGLSDEQVVDALSDLLQDFQS